MKKKPRKPKPSRWLHLGVSVTRDIRDRLHACAHDEQRSISFIVRSILEAALPPLTNRKS